MLMFRPTVDPEKKSILRKNDPRTFQHGRPWTSYPHLKCHRNNMRSLLPMTTCIEPPEEYRNHSKHLEHLATCKDPCLLLLASVHLEKSKIGALVWHQRPRSLTH